MEKSIIEKMPYLSFKDVENLNILKRFQKILYSLSNLTFDFVDIQAHPSSQLKAFRKYVPFCKLINQSACGHSACEECDIKAIENCLKTKKPVIYCCHLSLVEIVVPVSIRGEPIGVLTSGQFLFSRPTEEKFKKIEAKIKTFGVNLKKAKENYLSIPVIKKNKAEVIVDLICLVAEYIVESENKISALKKIRRNDKIRQAQDFIELHYRENISIKDVALRVHLSSSRLAHIFRERFNANFTSYLNELRIEEAKFLLKNTNIRIIEVAYKVGFQNLSHFNHVFKEKVGSPPSKYRQHITTSI